MNDKSPTDLQVSQELEALSIVINQSIDKAKNILEEAKEIDEVRELIHEIHLSREELLKVNNDLKKHEDKVSNYLSAAKELQDKLQILQEIPKQLHELGIREDILQDLQLVINEINHAKIENQSSTEASHNILLQVQNYLQESQDIVQELQSKKEVIETLNIDIDNKLIQIRNIIDRYDEQNRYTQSLIQELNLVIQTIGGVEEIQKFIQDIRNTRLEMHNSEQQLLSARQQMIAVQGFENYLNNFQNIRNRKQLWQWLWNELGFVGVIVYLLSLIIPKRRR
ncbi:hypothetical protein H6G33_13785 [Calothrix sp. FACHB-1219]|uniref:hypothetical protein n=1 Tax=unclassified Calothrix TaxID=2619626 RepID=UPI0016875D8B|nr:MULTISPECIES: hypothetical protein [unclassified Calothrix]MBD2204745.1 hypothetical protein [Calothrix sp. FACHB-168]MBD2218107.1 hypothetical protein [Calothrix sp. FACHB-1219]